MLDRGIKTILFVSIALLFFACDQHQRKATESGCAHCHYLEKESIGPSLRAISAVYPEKDQLHSFMMGESSHRIDPSRAFAMEVFRIRYRSLEKNDQKIILDWVYEDY